MILDDGLPCEVPGRKLDITIERQQPLPRQIRLGCRDDPGYIFSEEERTLWEPRYAQVLVESLDLSDPPVARN